MQFSTKIDGFEQKDSQGFENSYNSYEQYPLEKFFIFTIYQNYTLALILYAWDFFESASMHNSYIFSRKWNEKQNKTKQNKTLTHRPYFPRALVVHQYIFLGLYTGWPKKNGTAYFR